MTEQASSDTPAYNLLVRLASEALEAPVNSNMSLVGQGFDSFMAKELTEALKENGYEASYAMLLRNASISSLARSLRQSSSNELAHLPELLAISSAGLTGQQLLWANLEQRGWGSWANISLCLSVPASIVSPHALSAISQSLCDANDSMRMILTKGDSEDLLGEPFAIR